MGDVDVTCVEVGEERREGFPSSFEWSWWLEGICRGGFRSQRCGFEGSRLGFPFRRHLALLVDVMLEVCGAWIFDASIASLVAILGHRRESSKFWESPDHELSLHHPLT